MDKTKRGDSEELTQAHYSRERTGCENYPELLPPREDFPPSAILGHLVDGPPCPPKPSEIVLCVCVSLGMLVVRRRGMKCKEVLALKE